MSSGEAKLAYINVLVPHDAYLSAHKTTTFNPFLFSHGSQMHRYCNHKSTILETTIIVSLAQSAPVPVVKPAYRPNPIQFQV